MKPGEGFWTAIAGESVESEIGSSGHWKITGAIGIPRGRLIEEATYRAFPWLFTRSSGIGIGNAEFETYHSAGCYGLAVFRFLSDDNAVWGVNVPSFEQDFWDKLRLTCFSFGRFEVHPDQLRDGSPGRKLLTARLAVNGQCNCDRCR